VPAGEQHRPGGRRRRVARRRERAGRWPAGAADRFGLTETERLRIWKQATLAARTAAEHIAAHVADNPASAADAAWAASDFLAAAGRVVEGRKGGPLTDAAQQYDSAAREMFGRTPAPTAAGTGCGWPAGCC
jgi:hypothetical protein